MFSCGMYDYSGQWAFDVGLPAKSGVSGCVFVVIPNVCGISIFSPRLDPAGNSVRAVCAMKKLINVFSLHYFQVFQRYGQVKIRPTVRKNHDLNSSLYSMLFAAMEGDFQAMEAHCRSKALIFRPDYDGRTVLHLAATEGHLDMTIMLLDELNKLDPTERRRILDLRDRWHQTAFMNASEFPEVEEVFIARWSIEMKKEIFDTVPTFTLSAPTTYREIYPTVRL